MYSISSVKLRTALVETHLVTSEMMEVEDTHNRYFFRRVTIRNGEAYEEIQHTKGTYASQDHSSIALSEKSMLDETALGGPHER